jgi:hypothetical protein
MMILFALAAIAVVLALSLHHSQWRRGAAAQHVLAVLPAALLFLTLPIPVLMFSTVRGFQQIARQGSSANSLVVGYSLDINRALWLGSLGVLATMLVAGFLQWRSSPDGTEQPAEESRTWRDWLLLACALVVIPTMILAYIGGEVPRTVIGAMEMTTGTAPSNVPSSELGNLSAKIAGLILTGFIGGLVLAIADLFAAAGAVFAASGIRQPRRAARAGWVLLAITLLGAAWNVMQLPVERRWIERVAAAAAARHR